MIGFGDATLDSTAVQRNAVPLLLYVVNDPAFFLSHRLNIARAARAQGWDVAVATPELPGSNEIRAEGFHYFPIPLHRYSSSPLGELRTLLHLVRLYRRQKPDIVHHVTIKPVLYGSVAALIARLPGVVNAVSGRGQLFSGRGAAAMLRRSLAELLYRAAFRSPRTRVIFQNESDREYFVSRRMITRDRTRLIRGAGVDVTLFRPLSLVAERVPDGLAQLVARRSPRSPGTAPPVTVLFHSRLLIQKGIREFVAACQALSARGITALFVVAGERGEENPGSVSRAELEEWRSYPQLLFLGYVADIPALLRQTDIVCLPTYYNEGVPKALVEAAAAGRPIVTTDWPGCRDIVRHEKNGLLVPPRDSDSLAAALERLICDAPLRHRLGAAGGEVVLDGGFSEEAVVRATLKLYEELAGPMRSVRSAP